MQLQINEHDLMHLFDCLHNFGIDWSKIDWPKWTIALIVEPIYASTCDGRYDTMQIKLQSRIEKCGDAHAHTRHLWLEII